MSDNDDKIISLFAPQKQTPDLNQEFMEHHRETHFFVQTFRSYDEADKYLEDTIAQYDPELYFVNAKENKRINDSTYRAGLSIYLRQAEFDF